MPRQIFSTNLTTQRDHTHKFSDCT